jgi:galactosyl transferase GMA12/MNN10 family
MYAVASINLPNYQDLADLTDQPKIEYCNRHGYKFFVLKENKYSDIMGFNKIGFMLDLLKTNQDIEWLLFSECDATITNLTIPMEQKIDNDFHVIIPVDRLSLNAGNLLVRNSTEGRGYLQMLLDAEPDYKDSEWAEQQVMIDTIDKYTEIVKIVDQRYMNSYIQYPYDYCDVRTDVLGNNAEWRVGDWILHMPGLHKPVRIAVTKDILTQIIR